MEDDLFEIEMSLTNGRTWEKTKCHVLSPLAMELKTKDEYIDEGNLIRYRKIKNEE